MISEFWHDLSSRAGKTGRVNYFKIELDKLIRLVVPKMEIEVYDYSIIDHRLK